MFQTMNHSLLIFLSFAVGVLVVIQGSMNARLGVLLSNPLLATAVALSMGAALTLAAVAITVKHYPTLQQVDDVPFYYWFVGGALSVFGITLFYYVIPRIGISTTVTFGLTGQLLFAAIAGHYGWFGMPAEPISINKAIGMVTVLAGAILIRS